MIGRGGAWSYSRAFPERGGGEKKRGGGGGGGWRWHRWGERKAWWDEMGGVKNLTFELQNKVET